MRVSTKQVLWDNVLAIMVKLWGRENVTGFAAWSGIGVGSVQRIRDRDTSVGLDILEKIAEKAKVEPWQLLTPQLDTSKPPMLATDAARMQELMKTIAESQKALAALVGKETASASTDDASQPAEDFLGGRDELASLKGKRRKRDAAS